MTGAICVAHKQVGLSNTWIALTALQRPQGTVLLTAEGTTVAKQRNVLAQQALDLGAAWVLFVDDDHVFPPDALLRLLAWEIPVVGGLYVTRTPPYRSTAMHVTREPERRFTSLTVEEMSRDGLVDVDCLGMGFTLIRREAFDAVTAPYFMLGRFAPDEMGEDTYFTSQVRAAGLRVACDVGLVIPHLAVKAVVPARGRVEFRDLADALRSTREEVSA